MNKKNLLIGSALVLAALLVVGGTMAWFTAAVGPVTNRFTAGTVEIKLHDVGGYDDDKNEVPFTPNGIPNVNPGDEYLKIVYVENTGSKAIYVRAKLTPEWKDPDGNLLPLEAGTPPVLMATFPLLDNGWFLHTDGYYYYKDPVAPGASTAYLIDGVEFAGAAMTNDYQGATFTLMVEAEAVQASHEAYKDEWGTGVPTLTPYTP